MIYASLGTLVNGLTNVYRKVLEAVSEFRDMQVVLSVGKNLNPGDLGPIPSNTIVVRVAPQLELLKRAALCITHAGLNTALEALAQGVPVRPGQGRLCVQDARTPQESQTIQQDLDTDRSATVDYVF